MILLPGGTMRPHPHDHEHNLRVGAAFRKLVGDLVRECGGFDQQVYIDEKVGEHVNAIAQAAYDLGRHEVEPSQN